MQDHFALVVIAVVAVTVLGAYTALAFVGVDASYINPIRDVLLALTGSLGTIAIPKVAKIVSQDSPPS